MTWSHAVKIRKGVQILFCVAFVALLFTAVAQQKAPALADLFFRLNPLSALGAALATRSWVHGLEWTPLSAALLTVAATLLFGRVWCGWICPLGTLLEWVTFRRRRGARRTGKGEEIMRLSAPTDKKGQTSSPYEPFAALRPIKTILLALILVAAALGNLTLLAFDPIALITRTMGVSVIPAFNYGVSAVETAMYHLPFLRPLVDAAEGVLRGPVLPVKQPAFSQNFLIAALFCGILALNLLAPRFWCRYLCPLGALLGWLSKIAIFRPVVGQSCNRCTRCALVCRPAAVDTRSEKARILPSECTACLDCLADCKKQDIRYQIVLPQFHAPKASPETRLAPGRDKAPLLPSTPTPTAPVPSLSRREALGVLGAGVVGVLLLRTDLRARKSDSLLIRPPGAQDEEVFLSTCLRCSQCLKICPTSALQPAAFESGLEGLWTPVLVPRVGYCDYGCTACGQVCPSGAIPKLNLERKREAVIGKASVNHNRCLPWASATPCIVCEEMCPTPQKSIRLEEVSVPGADGQSVTVQRPSVMRDLCIGCGICENHCPLEGEAGIRVYGV